MSHNDTRAEEPEPERGLCILTFIRHIFTRAQRPYFNGVPFCRRRRHPLPWISVSSRHPRLHLRTRARRPLGLPSSRAHPNPNLKKRRAQSRGSQLVMHDLETRLGPRELMSPPPLLIHVTSNPAPPTFFLVGIQRILAIIVAFRCQGLIFTADVLVAVPVSILPSTAED